MYIHLRCLTIIVYIYVHKWMCVYIYVQLYMYCIWHLTCLKPTEDCTLYATPFGALHCQADFRINFQLHDLYIYIYVYSLYIYIYDSDWVASTWKHIYIYYMFKVMFIIMFIWLCEWMYKYLYIYMCKNKHKISVTVQTQQCQTEFWRISIFSMWKCIFIYRNQALSFQP